MRVSKIPQPLKVVYLASYLIKPVSFKFDPKLCALTAAWDVTRESIEGKCKVVGGNIQRKENESGLLYSRQNRKGTRRKTQAVFHLRPGHHDQRTF
jgi:hypothetical protein